MRIKNSQLKAVLQTAQRIESSSQNSPAMQHKAKANTSGLNSFRASRQAASDLPQSSQNAKSQGGGERRRASDLPDLASRAMKYTLGVAGAAYLYDKTANNCFLTTTSLHDGKGGLAATPGFPKLKKTQKNTIDFNTLAPTIKTPIPTAYLSYQEFSGTRNSQPCWIIGRPPRFT